MRSPVGSILVILGLATTLVLVLVLFQAIGLRGDLQRVQDEVTILRTEAEVQTVAVDADELQRQLGILESGIRDWLIATGVDGPSQSPGAGGQGDSSEVLDRLDEVLDRIDALDARLDQICESVPIC